jgi:hypothetical protein
MGAGPDAAAAEGLSETAPEAALLPPSGGETSGPRIDCHNTLALFGTS